MALTELEVRNAKAENGPRKVFDGGGLYLRVDTKGSKLWRLAYRYGGKERTLSFGSYPEVSLKVARAKRDEAKAQLAEGIDPNQAKRSARALAIVSTANTFDAITKEVLDKKRREGNELLPVSWTPRKGVL